MTPEQYRELIRRIQNHEWTPEVFETCRVTLWDLNLPVVYTDAVNYYNSPNIFNDLRRILTDDEYTRFDMEYCEYFQPGQKAVAEFIRKARGEKQESKEVKGKSADRKSNGRKSRYRFAGFPEDW